MLSIIVIILLLHMVSYAHVHHSCIVTPVC